ncbi:unnamed protein product [Acanthoscelides obtectus]|uniref:Uncharacterized protein n=1 Tax=Acanthoscelides obtectus TaxID=200917 RepID=A0A9P0M7N8_ACAOB|nr:unnamed protein product [Acanthoscelides obtectus]CAK1648501.1 hypothetical protein AOBTE_LOCUS15731 [Acanthoscelides obtectus]
MTIASAGLMIRTSDCYGEQGKTKRLHRPCRL